MATSARRQAAWPLPLSLREWPRSYADGRPLLGHEALLVEVDHPMGSAARVLAYQPGTVTELQLPIADVVRRYQPALELTGGAMARVLLGYARTQARAGPGVAERLVDHYSRSSAEDPKMTTKKNDKPAAGAGLRLPCVCTDVHRRTCLAVGLVKGIVTFVPLLSEGLDAAELSEERFLADWTALPTYPPARAAELYAKYASYLGATEAAMKVLRAVFPVPAAEAEAAVRLLAERRRSARPARAEGARTPKPAAAREAGPAPTKPAAKAKPDRAPRAAGRSAAAAFRELILAGRLSDEKIFAAVQKEFGLSDDKAGYVNWYRKDLTKKGLLKA